MWVAYINILDYISVKYRANNWGLYFYDIIAGKRDLIVIRTPYGIFHTITIYILDCIHI